MPVPIGTVRCLACGRVYKEPPWQWQCIECGGDVSQKAGEIHVPAPEPEKPRSPRGDEGSGS